MEEEEGEEGWMGGGEAGVGVGSGGREGEKEELGAGGYLLEEAGVGGGGEDE